MSLPIINDVSQDDNGDTHDDSGTLALTITIVSRQGAEDVIGGSLTLTGYPEGTINLALSTLPGGGIGSNETNDGGPTTAQTHCQGRRRDTETATSGQHRSANVDR